MKLLELNLLKRVIGGAAGGGTKIPDLPPREAEKANTDGSYTPPPKTEEGD